MIATFFQFNFDFLLIFVQLIFTFLQGNSFLIYLYFFFRLFFGIFQQTFLIKIRFYRQFALESAHELKTFASAYRYDRMSGNGTDSRKGARTTETCENVFCVQYSSIL